MFDRGTTALSRNINTPRVLDRTIYSSHPSSSVTMMFHLSLFGTIVLALMPTVSLQHERHATEQVPVGFYGFPYQAAYSDDFFADEVTAYSTFSGITTFAKLPWVECLTKDRDTPFDIAFLGAPFVSMIHDHMYEVLYSLSRQDTATSYRPGARFGPAGIRAGSRRLTLYGGYNVPLEVNPFQAGLKIVDCGDIPVTPYDNHHAIGQISRGHQELLQRNAATPLGNDTNGSPLKPLSLDGRNHPRIITLGGDHTITLPLLR